MSDTAAPVPELSAGTTLCANCGAGLSGPFCSNCGQKRAHGRPTLHDFFHDAIHEFLHVDGKIFRTVRLLVFSPGTLTSEFNAGRRSRYISPIRLYLIFSVVFFALLAVAGKKGDAMKVSYKPNELTRATALEKRMLEGVARAESNPAGLSHAIESSLAKAMFVLMPLFAALMLLFFRRQERYYIPHLYASIHLHAFAFLLFAVVLAARLTGWRPLIVGGAILALSIVPYYFLMLRRLYTGRTGVIVLKGIGLGMIYFLLLNATMLLIALYTILTL